MAQHLFPKFLHDPDEYARSEAYWRLLWEEVSRFAGQQQVWRTPWLQTSYADGTPFRDGDPIFSAWSPSRRLGVRVIQDEPREKRPELAFWSDIVGDKWSGEVHTLVISCALSRETAALARDLVFSWMRDGRVSVVRPLVLGGDWEAETYLACPSVIREEAPLQLPIPAWKQTAPSFRDRAA